jgi:hypothetical protein
MQCVTELENRNLSPNVERAEAALESAVVQLVSAYRTAYDLSPEAECAVGRLIFQSVQRSMDVARYACVNRDQGP